MDRFGRLIGAFLLGAALFVATPVAHANELPRGTVVVLGGTTHIWVADDIGILHWVGDTRALATHPTDWDNRRDVTLSELLQMPRGTPWLSSGLLKIGEPIYLVKWETSDSVPTLAQVRSIRDLELFGIDARNWGALVYEAPLWERRFGISASRLPRTTLEPALTMPSISLPPAPLSILPPPSPPSPTSAPVAMPSLEPERAGAPMSDLYRLNRTPMVRADGDLPLGVGEGWAEGISLDDRDHRPDVPYSSHVLAQWTIGSGTSTAYVRVVSVNLDYNKDISSNGTLARKVFDTYCRSTSRCEGTVEPAGAITVDGLPALRYDTRTRIEYWSTPAGGGSNELVQHEWLASHVFFVRGEWGYEVRIFSEHPSTFQSRAGDVLASLARVKFRKP